ncbi:hypothetical protein ACJJTC_015131 [Scirpophaga incertulas]
MWTLALFILSISWNQDIVSSVRLTELRVSQHVVEGGDTVLGCQFDMENDTLYSLKWYKDGREFYRFIPKSSYPTKVFFVKGVHVDSKQTTGKVLALKRLSRDSAGLYRCEVHGEGPDFSMAYGERHVNVDLLPETGPHIVGLHKEYQYGSLVSANCTTGPSRPEAQLAWYINGIAAPDHYLGLSILVMSPEHPHTYQSKLNLNFTVYQSHFIKGVLTLKCQATIPPLYHKETIRTFYDKLYKMREQHEQENNNQTDSGRVAQISLTLLLVLVLYTLNQ